MLACLAKVAPKDLCGWDVKGTQGIYCSGGRVAKIVLERCGLTSLPASIGDLAGLYGLHLSNNFLTSLPDSIGDLGLNLRVFQTLNLDLSNNGLTSLPASIGKLRGLGRLDLKNNFLAKLPDSIGDPSKLYTLLLDRDVLQDLPSTMSKLTKMHYFTAANNPFNNLQGASSAPSSRACTRENTKEERRRSSTWPTAQTPLRCARPLACCSLAPSADVPPLRVAAAPHAPRRRARPLDALLCRERALVRAFVLAACTNSGTAVRFGGIKFSATLDGQHTMKATDLRTG